MPASTGRRESASRADQKARTRAALVAAAISLSAERGFSAVSLRDVAREVGIVPTAFYRHFATVEDLGTTLAEEGMRCARGVLRDIRRHDPATGRAAAQLLADHIAAQPRLLRFVVTERFTAPAEVRRVIAVETRMLAQDLAVDLARRFPRASPETLEVAAQLVLDAAFSAVVELTAPGAAAPESDAAAVISRVGTAFTLIHGGITAALAPAATPAHPE